MKKALGLCLLTLTLLTACSGSDTDSDGDKAPPSTSKSGLSPICPQVAIVRGLDSLTDYGQDSPSPGQLVAAATLTGIEGTCEYKTNGIDVLFDLDMIVLKGPRLGGLHFSVPYFVAIMDPTGQIVDKDQMTADISFSSNEKKSDHAESLHVFIPLAADHQTNGPDYQVLLGFQLNQEQLEQKKKDP